MSTVSHKIKLTVTAEYFPVEVDGGVAAQANTVSKPTGVVYNRVVIQGLLIIK